MLVESFVQWSIFAVWYGIITAVEIHGGTRMSHVGLSEHDDTLLWWCRITHTHTHTYTRTHTHRVYLNSVSSQCARGKSSIARKPEFHPNNLMGFFFLKNVTIQTLNLIFLSLIIKYFPIRCNVNFVSVFTALNNTIKQREFNITP